MLLRRARVISTGRDSITRRCIQQRVSPLLQSMARPRHLCDDARRRVAAAQAIKNAERSAGELAAAEKAVSDDAQTPFSGAKPTVELVDLHGEPLTAAPRFPLGAKVECRLGEDKWAVGVVIGHNYREKSWPSNRRAPYQVQIEGGGPTIYTPADVDACIRTTLRFGLESVVECYLGEKPGWLVGVVVKHYHREASWEAGKWAPYQIKVQDGSVDGTLVFAPVDSDECVRAATQWPWPGSKPPEAPT
jgi:hypothetical protein